MQMTFSRTFRDRAKIGLRKGFELGQRLGVDILPRHFYSSIPDVAALRSSAGWRQPRTMAGVRGLELDSQLSTLQGWFTPEVCESIKGRSIQEEAATENGATGYGPTESAMLYAFVATQRPQRVIQIGAGVSTAVILRAALDHGVDVKVTCIDPFPTEYLERLAVKGEITLIKQRAQDVSMGVMTDLADNDLFFVDSTHTVKPDSEVNRIILEVLPRLRKGCHVHFHDIWFPFDYPRDLLEETLFFWNESVLLHAFLSGNARFEMEVCGSWLHYEAAAKMSSIVPGYEPEADAGGLRVRGERRGHFPSAAYMKVLADI